MISIFAILFKMNNRSLDAWPFFIQFNSLIAIFSTIAKSSVLVALTGGLSQLEWNHFEETGGTLDHLQYFDAASRGPWGSFVFFFRMRKSRFGVLAALGAILTVVALAFEPFTQQIVEFPSRSIRLSNVTANTTVANTFELDENLRKNCELDRNDFPLISR
jgi:hypothetical protein